jgi:hypothetical protein
LVILQEFFNLCLTAILAGINTKEIKLKKLLDKLDIIAREASFPYEL